MLKRWVFSRFFTLIQYFTHFIEVVVDVVDRMNVFGDAILWEGVVNSTCWRHRNVHGYRFSIWSWRYYVLFSGHEVVIVKSGQRVCGSGCALGNAPLVQSKSYFEVKLQQGGVWAIGLATRNTDLDRVHGMSFPITYMIHLCYEHRNFELTNLRLKHWMNNVTRWIYKIIFQVEWTKNLGV